VKLNVHEIEEDAKQLTYEEPTASLTTRLAHGGVVDFEFPAKATVDLEYYRAGLELFFNGHIEGPVLGHCARCLETYEFPLHKDFSLVLVPAPETPSEAEDGEEVDLAYYSGDEVDLTPLVDEQIILALPTRPLCSDDCKGLCPSCGKNQNVETCTCSSEGGDPRLAVLRNLKIGN
jgi:uncharacterized protein